MNPPLDLILASQSSYRKELLERLQVPFRTQSSNVDESIEKEKKQDPITLAKNLALLKAKSVFKDNSQSIVIGSDQVAFIDQTILDKPENAKNALKQLSFLQGKTHYLVSAVCLYSQDSVVQFENVTSLTMKHLKEEQLKHYISVDQPFDCAGSYKIECFGISLFEKIDCSDFTSIVGLPLIELSKHLQHFGFQIP